MKNKLLSKIIIINLVSLIGLTSISSFNHVFAQELDNFSYTNQLVSSSNINHLDYPPVVPEPNNPKTWIGVLTALFTVIGIKNSLNFNKTINVLQNGFADNRTGVFVDSLIKSNPSFNFDKFASDNNVLSGNYTNINPSLIKDLHVDPKLCIELENHNTNLNYNGGNKNYYTNNDYSSTNNYSVFNSSTNNINYTYNNQTYNYTVNNMFYNYVTNEYTFNTTNNQNITYINNYNNTTIISPSGQSQKLYYKLPDGSNSLNLTEEQAKKGFKTSLNVASYSNGFDDDDLNFLFHFDSNEYDSAYPINNFTLKAIPNSVDYIDSSNSSFNQAIAFTDSFDLSVEGSNYKNYYSFRIYPQVNDKWSLNINGVDIASRISKIDTKYDYVEWDSKSTTAYWHMITVVNNLPNQCPDTWTNFGNTYDRSTEKYTTSCGYKIANTSITTQRTYNIINNKLFEDSGSNLLNYNQWNFISIDTSGKVFINGVDSELIVPLDLFKISVTGDSITYIDELVSFKSNHSSVAPSLPYDSNITYYLPGVQYKEKTPLIRRVIRRSVSGNSITPDFNKGYDSFNTYQRNGSNPTWSYNFTTPVNITGFKCNVVNNRGSVKISVSSNGSIIGSISGDGNGTVNLDNPVLVSSFSIYMDGANYNGSGYYVYSIEPFTIYYSKPITKYSVNLTSNGNGTVSGGGSFDSGSVVSISASPDPNYRFKQWSDGNTDNPRSITVNGDITLSATFELIPPYEEKTVTEYNNLLLIQSLIPCLSWKFGGIRPSNPNNGDVYCSVNENGNITSVQQFNGIEWVKVVGSIYNDALGLWVNAIGFNIFIDNWSYQDIDYRADDPNVNILIRFLTSQFDKITGLLNTIIEKIKGISSDDITINNYQNNYDVDVNTNIDNLINTSKDYDKDIDLDSPDYNVDDSTISDLNNLAVGSKGIFKALDDSGFSILYLAPLILLLVGLLL